jgi:chloroplastic oxoene reductase
VTSENLTVKRHVEVSTTEGVSLPIVAGTALQAFRAIVAKFDDTSNKPSSNVLITATFGSVGLYVVQLARLAGLHVTATCGACNMELGEEPWRGRGARLQDSRGSSPGEPLGEEV